MVPDHVFGRGLVRRLVTNISPRKEIKLRGQGSEQTLPEGGVSTANGPVRENRLSVVSQQGRAGQNHAEMPPRPTGTAEVEEADGPAPASAWRERAPLPRGRPAGSASGTSALQTGGGPWRGRTWRQHTAALSPATHPGDVPPATLKGPAARPPPALRGRAAAWGVSVHGQAFGCHRGRNPDTRGSADEPLNRAAEAKEPDGRPAQRRPGRANAWGREGGRRRLRGGEGRPWVKGLLPGVVEVP